MNQSQAQQMLPLVQALADGKKLEYRLKGTDEWRLVGVVQYFDFTQWEYRVEPEEKVFYVNVYEHSLTVVGDAYPTAERADNAHSGGRVARIKVKYKVGMFDV